MEGLALAGLVDARLGVGADGADIPDVAEKLAAGVLGAGASNMRSQPEEDGRGLVFGVAVDVESADQSKSEAVNQLLAQIRQHRPEGREREIFAGDPIQSGAAGARRGGLQFGNVIRRQADRPGLRAGRQIAAAPCRRGALPRGHGQGLIRHLFFGLPS